MLRRPPLRDGAGCPPRGADSASSCPKRVSTLADATRPGGRRRLGENKARRLHELAAKTIAPPELDAQMSFEVGMLIQQFDLPDKQIEIAEQRVAEVLDSELARRLQTIPGVGPALAATFIAEIGDIWRFDDFDQLASYGGVHPKEQSSGTKGQNPETSWHMAKTGNSYLRSALQNGRGRNPAQPWINPFLDGADALETAIATLERIGLLDAHVAVAGHGGVIEDVADCIKGSLERLRLWRQEPRRMAYHGSRRIFGFALMIHGGFPRSQLMTYLQARRWVRDFAPLAGLPSQEFAERVVSDLLRSGAARWEEDRLISTVPHSRVTL